MGNSRTCDRLSDLWGLYTLTATSMGTDMSHPLVQMIIDTSETKTLGYKALGVSGMLLVVIKAMLCNWMVTLGVVMAFTSSSTIGKSLRCGCPSWSFRSRLRACRGKYVCDTGGHDARGGCQHGRLVALEPNPVLIGNFIGGAVFTGAMLHLSHFGFGKRSEVNPIGKVHHGLRVMEATAVPVDKDDEGGHGVYCWRRSGRSGADHAESPPAHSGSGRHYVRSTGER